uniref:Uncharacterized protein n=1 Tax=Anopheles atroparvus TaxID=41427 RepID=A0AAG5DJE2_ANOAO
MWRRLQAFRSVSACQSSTVAMYVLRCVVSLTSRPFLVVVLQSVLCALWALPLVSGSKTFKRNGTTPGLEQAAMTGGEVEGSYRASRDARSFGLAPFGLDSGGREEGFYGNNEFSLYPTQWSDITDDPGSQQIPTRDSELVRLVEGEFDQDVKSQPFTNQPFPHDHQEGTDGDDEGIRLFSTGQGEYDNANYQRELFGDPFAQGPMDSIDTVSDFPDSFDDGEVYEQRTNSHIPSFPNQSQEEDLIVMAATPTLTRVSE